jgi:beta-lactamase regulating signal transducer with metallopeptidase domain
VSGLDLQAGTLLNFVLERSVAFTVVFLVAAGLWLVAHKRMSSHVASLWFLLPLGVLVLPVEGWIPNPWRDSNPIESLALAVLPPGLGSTLVEIRNAEMPASSEPIGVTTSLGVHGSNNPNVSPPVGEPGGSWGFIRPLIVSVWILGVALYLLRLIRGQRRVPALLKSARLIDSTASSVDLEALCREAGVRTAPALLESPEFDSPVVWLGFTRSLSLPSPVERMRAAIVLPEGLTTRLNASELRWVLLHELAHIRRRDHWSELAQRILGAVFFFHPLVWATNTLARIHREMACDDAAMARCIPKERRFCARALLKVVAHGARLQSRPRATAFIPRTIPGLSSLNHSKKLARKRIMKLAETNRPIARGLQASGFIVILIASGVALAAARFPGATLQDAPSASLEWTPSAAKLATDWLMSAQQPDGGWMYAPPKNKQPKSPVIAAESTSGAGPEQAAFDPYYSDIALTAMAVQALVRRAAHEPDGKSVREAIDRGVASLLDSQDPRSGRFGPKDGTFMVAHMLATVAVAEASVGHMTAGRESCLEASLRFLGKARNPYAGWRYDSPPSGDNDTRMTGYALLALEAATEAGVGCDPAVFAAGLEYMSRNEDVRVGRTNYMEGYEHPFRSMGRFDAFPAEFDETPTAMHLLLRIEAGIGAEFAEQVHSAAALLGSKTPAWSVTKGSIDYSYWWHGTQALASLGKRGEAWQTWSENLRRALQLNQILDGPMRGAWPTVDAWSAPGMEVYTAAVGALALYAVLDSE